MGKRSIAIVDGNSLLHRAFHALPVTMTGSDGRPTNAVYGFLTMLFRLVDALEPFGVVVAFDCGKPQFRIDVLEQYKIHRPPTAPELKDQFPMVKRVLEAMKVPTLECEGWEGDDLLGTLSRQAVEAGHKAMLITSDKDAMQLVDDDITVVSQKKGMELAVYGPEQVLERFGVTPGQIIDFLGLMGDSSDNIPGVRGVGAKTAAKLLVEYGTLDAVLDNAEDIKGKVGENLREHAQDALDSRLVATIRRDVPVEVDFEESQWGGWDPARVLEVFKDFRVTSLIGRVLAEGEITEAQESFTPPAELHPVVTGAQAKRAAEKAATKDAWLGVALDDGAGDSLLPSLDLAVATPKENAIVCGADVVPILEDALVSARMSSPDVKRILHAADEPGEGSVKRIESTDHERLFDCGIAGYLLDSAASSYDVLAMLMQETGSGLVVGDDQTQQLAARAQAAAALVGPLTDKLDKTGSLSCFERCEMPLVPVLARMEAIGVSIDCEVLGELAVDMEGRIAALVAEIHDLADCEVNIDSPKQLAEVLFDKLGLPTGKRTKTGFSTDSSVLTPLAAEYPIAGKVLEYRELSKLKSTYVDALPRLMGSDDRIHTTFNQTVAATGRLSSSKPNLQNIPVRTELGRKIRAAFIPGPGFDLLLSADYSQIELRILAHLSGDEGLIEAFASGEDFHAATAARVFGVDPADVDTGLRSRAKATNFGIVYGISAHGLSLQLDIDRLEAQEMIDRYYAAYPKVREYLDSAIVFAKDNGYAETIFGRRRPIPELSSRNYSVRSFGERTAANHPIQGAAADIMKLAMIEVDSRLRDSGVRSQMLLQVHDELVFETTAQETGPLTELVREAMAGVAELTVPLEVDMSYGPDWAQAK